MKLVRLSEHQADVAFVLTVDELAIAQAGLPYQGAGELATAALALINADAFTERPANLDFPHGDGGEVFRFLGIQVAVEPVPA